MSERSENEYKDTSVDLMTKAKMLKTRTIDLFQVVGTQSVVGYGSETELWSLNKIKNTFLIRFLSTYF